MASLIKIKVIPNSGKLEWALDSSGTVKCHLKASPEGGKANKELIYMISRALKIPQSNIFIVQGFTTRNKLVKIPIDITYQEFINLLGLEPKSVPE